jgi:hypothetical protein
VVLFRSCLPVCSSLQFEEKSKAENRGRNILPFFSKKSQSFLLVLNFPRLGRYFQALESLIFCLSAAAICSLSPPPPHLKSQTKKFSNLFSFE